MKKIYFGFCFMLVSFYPSLAQAYVVAEIKTLEEAKRIAPLYHNYNQKQNISEEEFLKRWKEVHNQPGYYMLAAYPDGSSSQPLGFIDFAIFPSLFDSPSTMRIDSVYIDKKTKAEEEAVFRKLFDKVVDIGNKHKVKRIICDSGEVFLQEKRLFSITMEQQNKNTLFKKYLS